MKMRVLLLLPSLCTAAASASAQDLTFTHPSGATATFYGQVNLTFQGVDDGEKTYRNFVDNSNSTSRAGLWIDGPTGQNEFRFNIEAGFGLLNTAETNQVDNPNWIDWQRTDIRKLEGVFSGDFGSVWIGQGSMATDGAAEIDNSGTSFAGYVNLADTAGSFEFRDGEVLSGITIGTVFKDFDGGRRFRLRYDSPRWSGFTVSGAYGQDILAQNDSADYYDTALRYDFDNGVIGADVAIGYAWKDDGGETTEHLIGSASLTHIPTGLNATFAAGDQQDGNGNYTYAKFGWVGDVVSLGGTAISLDYYDGSDFLTRGSDSSSWGAQAVQAIDDWNLEGYFGYRSFSYDDETDADFEDLTTVLVGARWRF